MGIVDLAVRVFRARLVQESCNNDRFVARDDRSTASGTATKGLGLTVEQERID